MRAILTLIILALMVVPVYGAKKDKDGKPTTAEEKKHNDMVKAKGLDSIPCLKANKAKSRKQNAEDILRCIEGLPNK